MLKKCSYLLPALAGTLLFPFLICDIQYSFSNSIFSAAVFCVLIAFFRKAELFKADLRSNAVGYPTGILFSALTAFGFSISNNGAVDYSNVFLWCAILFYGFVFGELFIRIWKRLENAEKKLYIDNSEENPKRFNSVLAWIFESPVCLVLIMLICWTPCYLASFPGNFVYDAAAEFNQMTEGYRGDFPMLHTALITRLLSFGFKLTGSYNFGIMVFTVSQMILLAILFAHMLHTFYKMGGNRVILGILFLYCSVFPVIHLLVTCTVRDVMFSGLLTYSVFQIYRLCVDPKKMIGAWWKPIPLAVTIVLTILSRNNNTGIFFNLALALMCIVLLIIGKKQYLTATVSFTVTVWVMYLLLGGLLSYMCQPMTAAPAKSSMSVFTQSLVRAYEYEGDSWTKEEKNELNRFFNMKHVKYVPECGGSTKSYLKISTQEEQEEFMHLWYTIGRRYPGHYADALLANTIGMWFPGTLIDGYQEMGVKGYKAYEKSYFYFTEAINSPGKKAGLLPNIERWYKKLSLMISFEKVPLVSLIFSIGTHFWLLLFCCFYNIYRKNKHLYLPLIIMLCYMLITSFAPMVLLRYYSAIFFSFPIVIMFLFQPRLSLDRE